MGLLTFHLYPDTSAEGTPATPGSGRGGGKARAIAGMISSYGRACEGILVLLEFLPRIQGNLCMDAQIRGHCARTHIAPDASLATAYLRNSRSTYIPEPVWPQEDIIPAIAPGFPGKGDKREANYSFASLLILAICSRIFCSYPFPVGL